MCMYMSICVPGARAHRRVSEPRELQLQTVVSQCVGYYNKIIKILLALKAWPELSIIPHWQLGKT